VRGQNKGEVVEQDIGDELGELRQVETDANVEREEPLGPKTVKRTEIGNRQ
jgi:hypothetical protein